MDRSWLIGCARGASALGCSLGMAFAVARCSSGNGFSPQGSDAATDGSAQGDDASSAEGGDGASSDALGSTDSLGASDVIGLGDAGPPPGSGKTTYSCPAGGIDVQPGDDVAAAVNGAAANATLCIHGPHVASATLAPKAGQTIVGVDATAAISGGQVLTGWTPVDGGGAWVNTGTLPATAHIYKTISPGHDTCFEVTTYQDDVYYNDQRMMRVLSAAQASGQDSTLPAGQAVTPAETGRFFTDYAAQQISVSLDPTSAKVELATLDTIVSSKAQGVTLQNLLLEKALTTIVDGGKSWTIQDCTIRFAHNFGVRAGGGTSQQHTVLQGDLITNNGQYGIAGGGSFITVDDCELSWNNIANYRTLASDGVSCGGYWGAGANKFVLANEGSAQDPSLVVTGLNSHDNVGTGFWTDVYNQYVRVSQSRLHDNESFGSMHEISCDIEIDHDEIDHNGRAIKNTDTQGGGVLVNDTNDSNVHDNVIHDNAEYGVLLDFQGRDLSCSGPATSGDGGAALLNDLVQNNDVYMCAGVTGGSRSALAARSNQFAGNRYRVADTGGALWINGGSPTAWSVWQSAGEDTSGSVVSPCAYP